MVKRDDANVNSFLRAAGLNLKPTRSEEARKRSPAATVRYTGHGERYGAGKRVRSRGLLCLCRQSQSHLPPVAPERARKHVIFCNTGFSESKSKVEAKAEAFFF